MSRNLGATTLRRRARRGDPMRAYDDLPPELRRWIAGAVLPWCPRSCARIWAKAQRKGLELEARLDMLSRAEANHLARDQKQSGERHSPQKMKGGDL